jgi:hypothetical protein
LQVQLGQPGLDALRAHGTVANAELTGEKQAHRLAARCANDK